MGNRQWAKVKRETEDVKQYPPLAGGAKRRGWTTKTQRLTLALSSIFNSQPLTLNFYTPLMNLLTKHSQRFFKIAGCCFKTVRIYR